MNAARFRLGASAGWVGLEDNVLLVGFLSGTACHSQMFIRDSDEMLAIDPS